ncbi:hypothetical protein SPRG_02342 [Saprolegnia parasitica CBS 223.65]|uniref:Tubulin-tyrosine ligase n=1 Tax=Saprolegnia parasitica (strain CBS 223.65) TaxID=695850 RepID=A0A067D1L7_SAPPC|nr:hypothetical protein SPRG_02342 [Saprolegnia parasitica CBS 223.65]KDO32641.1 hypothetical protein SPRG_02342 [Saprolegnia parasitica CBS 223.65]|eukprot:XP_012196308.1 hypothetical protein SPRG_02342 [Saprolegnia parasitica CBS 223.65]
MLRHEVGRAWRSIPWNDVLEQRLSADKYFMRSGLIRKDLLPLYAQDVMPWTRVVGSYDELVDALSNDTPSNGDTRRYVLKLCDSSNAFGIFFFDDASLTFDLFLDKQKRVVQRYISPWLAHRHRKFHLRVLVLAVGHLDVYVFHDVRALVATEAYRHDALENPFVHVTNMSANKGAASYDEAAQNLALSDVAGLDHDQILDQIHASVRLVFQNLTRARNRRHFFSLPNCYELFGWDFMVDDAGRVLLLEVNPDPSLRMYQDGAAIVPLDVLATGVPSDTFTRVFSLQASKALASLRRHTSS